MIDGLRGRSKKATGNQPTGDASRAPAAAERAPRIGLGARLHRHGVTADQITVLGVTIAAGTAVLIGYGWFILATALIIIGGLMDALDGAVAKAAGATSKRGAFFDSTTDRVADGLIFGGVAWYFVRGHHPMLALLPFAILAAGNLVSYERAKAESLGFVAKGGLMERAERLIMLGTLLTFGQIFHVIFLPLLVALLALTMFTAGQRFARVWQQATAEMHGTPAVAPVTQRWRTGRVDSRWRAWRESAQLTPGTSAYRARFAKTPSSRGRARREVEPLASRVRKALQTDHSRRVLTRDGRQAGQRRARSTSRWTAAGGVRKRYDSNR